MREYWREQFMFLKNNKKGSSIVLLAMVFVTLAICITSAITIARALVVKSECESFGHLWTKAILSEYDRNLLEEYNIMAYWGNDAAVKNKIDKYLKYSAAEKLDAKIKGSSSELTGMELGDIKNFETALEHSFTSELIDTVMNHTSRHKREESDEDSETRIIRNQVVLDTLPSCDMDNSGMIANLINGIKKGKKFDEFLASAKTMAAEAALIYYKMGNHVTAASDKEGYFKNEWEYIIHGKKDDDDNYNFCLAQIALIRNASNLAYLFSDPEKMEVITTVAECATPGVVGGLTIFIVAEAWAALETAMDMDELLDNGRVPAIKTAESWKTDIGLILDTDDIQDKLDDEGKEKLEGKEEEIEGMKGAKGIVDNIKEGQTYDEYLLAIIAAMDKKTRLLRIMDIIQINMKYWHYRDFNLMEYYTGVRFTINANGKSYEFEDIY